MSLKEARRIAKYAQKAGLSARIIDGLTDKSARAALAIHEPNAHPMSGKYTVAHLRPVGPYVAAGWLWSKGQVDEILAGALPAA